MERHIFTQVLCTVTISMMTIDGMDQKKSFVNVARILINNEFRLNVIESEFAKIKSNSLLEQTQKINQIIQTIRAIQVQDAETTYILYEEGYLPLHRLLCILEQDVNTILSQLAKRDTEYKKMNNYTAKRDPIKPDDIPVETLAQIKVIAPFNLPGYESQEIYIEEQSAEIDEEATRQFLRRYGQLVPYCQEGANNQTVSSSPSVTVVIKDEPAVDYADQKKRIKCIPWFGRRFGLPGIVAAVALCLYARLKKDIMMATKKNDEEKSGATIPIMRYLNDLSNIDFNFLFLLR